MPHVSHHPHRLHDNEDVMTKCNEKYNAEQPSAELIASLRLVDVCQGRVHVPGDGAATKHCASSGQLLCPALQLVQGRASRRVAPARSAGVGQDVWQELHQQQGLGIGRLLRAGLFRGAPARSAGAATPLLASGRAAPWKRRW